MRKAGLTIRMSLLMLALFLTAMPDVCMADSSNPPIRTTIRMRRSRNPNQQRAPGNNDLTIERAGRDITVFIPEYSEYARVMVGHGMIVEFEDFATSENPTVQVPETMTGIYTITISLDDIDFDETEMMFW